MILDKEEHKQILLQLIAAASIPGNVINEIYNLKLAIESADIAGTDTIHNNNYEL